LTFREYTHIIILKVALGKQLRVEEKQMVEAKKIRLLDGKIGNVIRITSMNIDGVMRRRLLDLGFVPGAVVEVIRKSPLGDPMAFRVSQTTIALRKEESMRIEGELVSYE
jgi:ferrous iron transport protein A